jgi:hypothetical protein
MSLWVAVFAVFCRPGSVIHVSGKRLKPFSESMLSMSMVTHAKVRAFVTGPDSPGLQIT